MTRLPPKSLLGEQDHLAGIQGVSSPSRFEARLLEVSDASARAACFRLRHKYFTRERAWVADNPREPGIERDGYDENAWHIACFDSQGVCAYLRALPGRASPFMLDREFAPLLTGELRQNLHRQEALEISRLVIRADVVMNGRETVHHPVEHLLKALYSRATEEGYNRFYIVVEEHWPRMFARSFGLPFRVVGNPHIFPDGTRTVVAEAALGELEKSMRQRHAARYDWYRNGTSR